MSQLVKPLYSMPSWVTTLAYSIGDLLQSSRRIFHQSLSSTRVLYGCWVVLFVLSFAKAAKIDLSILTTSQAIIVWRYNARPYCIASLRGCYYTSSKYYEYLDRYEADCCSSQRCNLFKFFSLNPSIKLSH